MQEQEFQATTSFKQAMQLQHFVGINWHHFTAHPAGATACGINSFSETLF